MKFRDKMIEYFDNIPEGTVVVANAMYEQGFTRMSHDAFFTAQMDGAILVCAATDGPMPRQVGFTDGRI